MPIDYPAALHVALPSVRTTYAERDTLRYALSIGFGSAPLDGGDLSYVYGPQLRSFPTMALSLGYVSMRDMGLGIDYARMVQGGQRLVVHRPLPTAGTVVARHRVTDIADLGAGRGALLSYERALFDDNDGTPLATATMTAFCRGDGGFGGPAPRTSAKTAMPDRPPDIVHELATFPQQALLYRLAGDHAPLHADPAQARRVGFDRPILQGIASVAMIARAVVRHMADGEASRLREIGGRFSKPLYPGETLVVQIWKNAPPGQVALRAWCKERQVLVFDAGMAVIGDTAA